MKMNFSKIGALVILSVCHNAYANQGLFFNVTASSSSLTIGTTIPNHTYPYAGIRLNTPGVNISSGCTTNSNGYCLFSVSDTSSAMINFTGTSSPIKLTLCLNGKGPLSCQNYTVTPSSNPVPNPRFAYFGSLFSDLLTQCNVSPTNGELSNCTQSAFPTPVGIAINSAGTFAYISSDTGSVSQCNVDHTTGAISSCTGVGNGFNAPIGVTLNPAGTFAYIANQGSGDVSICPVVPVTGAFGTCVTASSSSIAGLSQVAINPAGTIAYLGSFNGATLTKCSVNAITGDLSACATAGPAISTPNYTSFNAAGTFAYVAGASSVSQCSVDQSTGVLSNCASTSFDTPLGVILNTAGTNAYVLNFNTISLCTVNPSTGLFLSCGTTGIAIASPLGVALLN